MAYALNTAKGTKRITLSSTGKYTGTVYNPTFRFTRPITLNENLLNVVSLDMISFKHPTFFSEAYMTGYITVGGAGAALTNAVTPSTLDPDNYLTELYPNSNPNDIGFVQTLDGILFYLLLFLKQTIQDDVGVLNYLFDDDVDNDNFEYNHKTQLTLLGVNGGKPFTITQLNANPNHINVLRNLIERRDLKLALSLIGASALTLTGNWCQLMGLSPDEPHVLSLTTPLDIRIPYFGHDHIAISCDIIKSQWCSMNGEAMSTAELLAIVPTPGNPGTTETYYAYTTGAKNEIQIEHIDGLTLEFTDKQGNYVLSLEDYILVLVLDQILPTPIPKEEDGHVSLFEARKATMEEARKKLRTSMNNSEY